MNTSPHTTRRSSPHILHETPKYNLPLNPGHKNTPSSRPSSSKPAPRPAPESPPPHHQPLPQTTPHPASTTYALSPGPTKPTLPTPWQQVEELSLIQRELTAELLATQGKNKGLVAENASLRERVSNLERLEQQGQGKPTARLLQLEAENHRLSGDLARIVRGSYDREISTFDSIQKELLALKKEQQQIDKYIHDSTEKQESLQIVLQRMAQNDQEDRVALDEVVALAEQYTNHLRTKTKEADETIRSLQPEVSGLQARVAQSTGLINDTRLQITEIGETCAGQNQSFAALRRTVDSLQADLQERMDDMTKLTDEVTVLIGANEGQTREIESLRASLHQATVERDEAQGELERLRMKATSLEDEHHFLQSDYSAKSADMLDKFSAQLRELAEEANGYREALHQLRIENTALEAALHEHTGTVRAEQDQDAQIELARQTKLAESHLQAVRDAERTNAILEEQLRHKDAEIALLQSIGGKKEKKDKRELGDSDEIDKEVEGGSSDESDYAGSKSNKEREGRKCMACGRYKMKINQTTQELNAAKLECGTLQQKLDKVKNLIQIYRQEKRQMEEYIEKEKRTAKSMIADVESLREVIEEKQMLISQLRDEVTHLRNEAVRAQQGHAQQLSHAQDLARIQVQLKEDEVKAKLDLQANLQKEIQRLQAKLQRRKEELKAAQKAKKEADQNLESQYDRLQMLDKNYLHSRHHHANYTNSTLSYLHSLESRITDMRNEIARAKQTQASCEAEVIEPLRNALRTVFALAQDAQRQFDADSKAQEEELAKLKAVVAALPQQLQQPQVEQLQLQIQLQHQLQQLQQYCQDQQHEHQQVVEQHEQLVLEQIQQIDELNHQIRLLQLQLLEERQQKPEEPTIQEQQPVQEPTRSDSRADVSQMYSRLDKTQELASQLRIVSDESQYALEKLDLLEATQKRAEHELATQRLVFEEMRAANDAFMRALEEQLTVLTQATPRVLEELGEPGFKLRPEHPDLEMNNFVNGLSLISGTDDESIPDIDIHIPMPGQSITVDDESRVPDMEAKITRPRTPVSRLQLDKLREFSEPAPQSQSGEKSGHGKLSAKFGSLTRRESDEGEVAKAEKGEEEIEEKGEEEGVITERQMIVVESEKKSTLESDESSSDESEDESENIKNESEANEEDNNDDEKEGNDEKENNDDEIISTPKPLLSPAPTITITNTNDETFTTTLTTPKENITPQNNTNVPIDIQITTDGDNEDNIDNIDSGAREETDKSENSDKFENREDFDKDDKLEDTVESSDESEEEGKDERKVELEEEAEKDEEEKIEKETENEKEKIEDEVKQSPDSAVRGFNNFLNNILTEDEESESDGG